jgi:Amt family ammonium transporter
MYPGADFAGKYFGFAYKDFSAPVSESDIQAGFSTADGTLRTLNPQVDFLFQAAFCATAATIVSGAVAGRMKFSSYLIYTALLTAVVYPVSGMWKWGGGWLAEMGFHDFAGSLVVHACGGFAGLAGAIALGPRIGRYTAEGKSVPIPGHNMVYATLGVFVLLIGWYGFNPGSQLAFAGASNTDAVVLIAANTTLAACAGGVFAMIASWVSFGKPDLSMALNGVLAGLVGITANCDCVTNHEAILIGAVAGVLVLLGIIGLDKLKIDDPVGAFPVHGLCGVWGGIATGLFGAEKVLTTQIIGSVAISAWAFVTMGILFFALKAAGQLRVSKEEEIEGLDIHEHGMPCYGMDAA